MSVFFIKNLRAFFALWAIQRIFMNRFCKLAVMLIMLQPFVFADSTRQEKLRGQTMKIMKEWYFCQKFLTYLYSDGKRIFVILREAKKHIVDKKAKAIFLYNQFAYAFLCRICKWY